MSENKTYELARWVYYKMKLHQSISLESNTAKNVWELIRNFDEEDNCASNGARKYKPWGGDVIGGVVAQKTWKIKDTEKEKITIWRLQ